ncbi:conserved hypothetical protein [Frankia sp. Hr75.2]|nr:conserved hypothetical protein [Frankia sp. Hr75.2]
MTVEEISWTCERIAGLGPTTDVPTAAAILDAGEWTVYEAIRRGTWDLTRVLRIGRKIKIPTYDLITLLYPGGQAAVRADEDATTDADFTRFPRPPARAITVP